MDAGELVLGIFIAIINAILWYFIKNSFDKNRQHQEENRREIQLLGVEVSSSFEAVSETLLNGNREKFNAVRKAKKAELMEELKYIHK